MKKIIVIYILTMVITYLLIQGIVDIREWSKKKVNIIPIDYNAISFFLDSENRDPKRGLGIAKQSLENIFEFQIKTSNFTHINSEIDNIWKQDLFDNNSHEFYAHSLIILWDLILAHQQDQNNDYLYKGNEIILSWIKKNKRFDPFNQRYAWEDHSTAKRTMAILVFYDYASQYIKYDELFKQKINDYINQAECFLENIQNYSFRHNHGIFQDIALLLIALHCSDQEVGSKIAELAIKRFQNQVLATFSQDGFHLENSPGYHYLTTDRCLDFIKSTEIGKYSITEEVKDIIYKADNLKPLFVMPNSKILPVGDTNEEEQVDNYIMGKKFIIDAESGYLIFKNDDDYLAVRTQSILANHRHNDAMSFVLFINGKGIFRDSGFLNYTKTQKRFFTNSVQAHNTIFPEMKLDNFNYNYNAHFIKFLKTDNFLFVKLEAIIKKNTIYRNIYFDYQNDLFVIFDFLPNGENFQWLRILNLSDKINHFTEKEETIVHENYTLWVCNEFKIYSGSTEPYLGWEARSLNDLDSSVSIINKFKDNIWAALSISDSLKCNIRDNILSINTSTNIFTLDFSKDAEIRVNDELFQLSSVPKPHSYPPQNIKRRLSSYRRYQLLFVNFAILILAIFTFLTMHLFKRRIKKIFYFIPLVFPAIFILLLYLNFFN